MAKIDISKLKPHKLNQKIYGDEEISQDFLDSIDEFGILVPLKVKPNNTIISGHRRWKGAKKLGLDKIPVETITFSSKLAEQEAILTYNKQRDKTYSQKMKEAEEWENIEKEKAKERKKTSTGGKNPQLKQNFAEADKGQSRDKIAQKIKIGSGENYRKAKKVWDKAKEGDKDAQKQVEKIDKGKESIHGAYKKIKSKERTKKIESRKKDNVRSFQTKNFNDIHNLYNDEFQKVDIDNNSVDHIITDPPYGQDFFYLWKDLSIFAKDKLKVRKYDWDKNEFKDQLKKNANKTIYIIFNKQLSDAFCQNIQTIDREFNVVAQRSIKKESPYNNTYHRLRTNRGKHLVYRGIDECLNYIQDFINNR